jgi:hypothetical protein
VKVQASFAAKDSEEAEDRSQIYRTGSCPACAGTHIVGDAATGAYSQEIGSKSQDVIATSVVVGSAGPLRRKDG